MDIDEAIAFVDELLDETDIRSERYNQLLRLRSLLENLHDIGKKILV